MSIRKATPCDVPVLARLACGLWGGIPEEREADFTLLTHNAEATCFLAFAEEKPIGFAQCQLRHDYVEGTETSPVGFLEGLFVLPEHQRQGFARQLVAACENWARSMGCSEFGSDCELDNADSLAFHLAIGFQEAGRTIWFNKKL